MGFPRVYADVWERINARTQVPDDQLEGTGCWVWLGPCCAKGYGQISVRVPGKKNPTGVRCHTAAYDMIYPNWREDHARRLGVRTSEMTLDHLCRETRCWNPDHLEPVSRSTNVERRNAFYRNET